MAEYIELIDKYEIRQSDGDYNPPSYIWVDNTGEIVRCRDCKYRDLVYPVCNYFRSEPTEEYDYCSKGRRNDG